MNIKGYAALTKSGIMEALNFRLGTISVFFGNIIYLLIVYFLWKSIFLSSGNEIVNGMTFSDTMIYLALAMAMFNCMEVFLVWIVGRNIQSGRIILDILKPIRFGPFMFFNNAGIVLVNLFLTLLPTMILVYFLSGQAFALKLNLLYFLVSFILSVILNFTINFFVATICLYTESTWGINIMKEVIVLLFSGATIPLAFFPETILRIVYFLPFHAIYHSPLNLLIHDSFTFTERMYILINQGMWVAVMIVISSVFWKFSLRRITVNGG